MTTNTTAVIEESTQMPRAFLGWRIVAVAFFAQLLSNAATLAAFSNFVLPLSEEFGIASGRVALGVPMAIASMGVVGFFAGRWLDEGHARIMLSVGALMAGLGLVLLSQARELWQVVLCFGLPVCFGGALFGPMTTMALVANWFVRRRGLALGFTVAGATIVSYIAPASAEYLIEHYDWRFAVQVFGCVTLALGLPIFVIFTIGRPEDVGQLPDGDSEMPPLHRVEAAPETAGAGEPVSDPAPVAAVAAVGMKTRGELVRDPRLWLLAVGFGLVLTSPIVLLTLIFPYAKTSLGLDGQQAALFFAAMVPFSLLGKVVLGALADMAPLKPAMLFIVVVNIIIWLIFYTQPSFPLFVATGALYGLGIGGVAPLQGVIQGRCFGRANFGTASGLGGVVAVALLIAASLAASVIQGDGEGYPTVFILQATLIAMGGVLLAIVDIPTLEKSADGFRPPIPGE